MKKIMDYDQHLLATYFCPEDWKRGLDFLTDDDKYLQVGTWYYPKGKKLDRHHHNIVERTSNITQECVVVMEGAMIVGVYDKYKKFVTSFKMSKGDFAVFFDGGHEYEIIENETRVLETKNGPFAGVDLDKTRF
jgi:hypothetical protein